MAFKYDGGYQKATSVPSYLTTRAKKNKASVLEGNSTGGFIIAYTDGFCRDNGRARAQAGIGVWFGDNRPL